MARDNNVQSLDAVFFDEYTSPDAILKYTRATAGHGISHLLDHDYKAVYLRAIECLSPEIRERGIRVLEFGCGGGMNLIHLTSILAKSGVKVLQAVGTDFSPTLIEAARREAAKYLGEEQRRKLEFHVAKNETLIEDLASATKTSPSRWAGSFDLIIGVNTLRYCFRGQREMSCARDVMTLLPPGGVCVNIDMNARFPAFRSALKNKFRKVKEEECYIPTLAEYASPFEQTGFEILRKENFCWVPHSAGVLLCSTMRVMSPVLHAMAPDRAMRSLVVARKTMAQS